MKGASRLFVCCVILAGCGSKQDEAITQGLVKIPAGKAWIGCYPFAEVLEEGCQEPAGSLEKLREVDLPAFEIDRLEVDGAEYQRCMDAGTCSPPPYGVAPTLPVSVTPDQAKAVCAFRGMRLPTEAEWEKAARGVGELRPYPWGTKGPTCGNGRFQHCPVERRAAPAREGRSLYGLYDLAGSVSEWTLPYQRPDGFDYILKGVEGSSDDRDLYKRAMISYAIQSDGSIPAGVRCVR